MLSAPLASFMSPMGGHKGASSFLDPTLFGFHVNDLLLEEFARGEFLSSLQQALLRCHSANFGRRFSILQLFF